MLKYGKNIYTNKCPIWTYFGNTVSRNGLQYYAIISCDTTLFFYIRANINPLKDVLKKWSFLGLIECLGENRYLSNADIEGFLTFIQTVPYGGAIYESCVITRISVSDIYITKTSMTLTPDPDFATQVILRIHYQFYCYVNCRQEKISILFDDD